MDPVTPVRPRASISSRPLSKSEEEIVKKLHSHPERLSSGELAKTLLSTFNKNLGKFSFATTLGVYLRWLEAQRRAPQTTINYNWKNVVMQWTQSLKTRNYSLKDLVLEVEHWKRSHGPFSDPKTEENARYPPTIAELEAAYNMDLRPHSARTPPGAPPSKKLDHYSEEPRRGYKGPELNKQEVTKSSPKHLLSSPNYSPVQTSAPGATIGLLVQNVRNYTNTEVVEIFDPDSRYAVTRLEAWLSNRTVHFRTIEDRDRAYYLLPDYIKSRKEKDLSQPLVKIYSDRGNKAKSDIDTSSGYTASPEKASERIDGIKDVPEVVGLYFMNTGRYSRKDVELLFEERDALNIVSVERLGKSEVVVRFSSIYLREKALDHLPSYLKDGNESSRKMSLFVVPFDPKVHGRHPASRLRERQINGPHKFYGTRADKNESRIEKPIETTHGRFSRWKHNRDENDDFRLPDRTLSDEGRLSRYESANNSSPEFSRKRDESFDKPKSPVFSYGAWHDKKETQYLSNEERIVWEQDQGDIFAGQWLDKLSDEITERRSKLNNTSSQHNALAQNSYEGNLADKNALQYTTSVVNEVGKAKTGLKRSRTSDPNDHREYMGDCSKRTKRANDSVDHIDNFDGDLSDSDGLDCSALVLTKVKRANALQMWDLLDNAKLQEKSIESGTSNSSENGTVAEEEASDGGSDGEDEAAEADAQRSNTGLREPVSSPEDGWCSSRDYWAGSSGVDSSELEEDAIGQVELPGADTVEMSGSDINLDADMAYGSPQTPSD